jgi:hypothetical protein
LDALEKGGTPKASAQPAATARKTATRKPAAKKPATGTKKD